MSAAGAQLERERAEYAREAGPDVHSERTRVTLDRQTATTCTSVGARTVR